MGRRTAKAKAVGQSAVLAPLFARQCLPVAVSLLVVIGIWDHAKSINFNDLLANLSTIRPQNWLMAAAFCLVSFLAIARYDRIVHGILRTGIANAQARHSGVIAVAIAQFAGLGLLTGSLVRWRMVPKLTLQQAIMVTAYLSGSFIVGWAVLVGGVQFLFGQTVLPVWVNAGITFLVVALIIAPFAPRCWPIGAPSSGAMLAILATICVDLCFAGLAFWVVLPPDCSLTLPVVLPVFLVAAMAGLVCGTPGGVGAFELTLLYYLPPEEHAAILSAALAFRMVYHALPAVLAGVALAVGPKRGKTPPRAGTVHSMDAMPVFAEAGLCRFGEFTPHYGQENTQWLSAARPNSVICLRQPISGHPSRVLNAHRRIARQQSKAALIYRATPRVALQARSLGWAVIALGHEPIIRPAHWHLDRPACRQLRRHLRNAATSGVVIEAGSDILPLAAMTAISTDWANEHGGERGFCLGHFDAGYVSEQLVWLAKQDDNLVGFVTFHHNGKEWVLDLMRQRSDAPPGTMQALIHAAVIAAKAQTIGRVSLAATLPPTLMHDTVFASGAQRILAHSGIAGLRQFKSSFAPIWVPRYALAPNKIALFLALWDVCVASARRDRSQPCRGLFKFYS